MNRVDDSTHGIEASQDKDDKQDKEDKCDDDNDDNEDKDRISRPVTSTGTATRQRRSIQ